MSWLDEFSHRLNELEAEHLLRQRRVVTPLPGALMRVDGQAMLAFCSNDYLGLAADASLARVPVEASEVAGLSEIVTAQGELRTLPCHLPHVDPRLAGLDGFYAARLVKSL